VSASCLRLMLWLRDDVRFSYSSRPSPPHHARLCGAKVRTTIAITFSSWSPLRIRRANLSPQAAHLPAFLAVIVA
jgi:hypothetical protein